MKSNYGELFKKMMDLKDEEKITLLHFARILDNFSDYIEWFVDTKIEEEVEGELEIKKEGDDN